MKYLIINFFIILLPSTIIFSQDKIYVAGTIKSAETGQPVIYANLFLKNLNKGTNSDENGNYNLILKEEFIDEFITISAIGFKTLNIKVKKLINQPNIQLEEDIYSLQEVIITPLNAYPIFKKASSKASKNYQTGWVSASATITQTIFTEENNLDVKNQYLGTSIIKGKINYKGNNTESLKWQIDSISTTIDFEKYEVLGPFSRPINLYDKFNKYEISRRINKLKKSNENKNVFNSKLYKENRYAKVIDFDSINGFNHYVIKTSIANEKPRANENKISIKIRNEAFKKRKQILKESLKNLPIAQNKDSLDKKVNEYLTKASSSNDFIINHSSYFWIEKESYAIGKYIAKTEYKRNDNNNIYNKVYFSMSYKFLKNKYVIDKIEFLDKILGNENGEVYKYTTMSFSGYGFKDDFKKIDKEKILPNNHNRKVNYRQKLLDKNKQQGIFLKSIDSVFRKPLKIKNNEVLDFYKDFWHKRKQK